MQAELWEKEITIRKKDDTIREKEMTIREKEDIIREKEDVIRKKENTIREKEDLIWKSENDIRGHKDDIKEKHEELKNVNEKVVELQKENKELESQVQEVNGEMAELQKENKELKTQVKNVTDQMVGLQNETEALKSKVQRKKDYIKELKKDKVYYKECYIKINEVIEKANSKIEQLEEYSTKKDDEIKSLKKLREEMKQLEEDLIKKDDEIKSLKAVNIMLEDDVQKQVLKKQILEEVHQAKMKQVCSQRTEIENLRRDRDALTESHKQLKSYISDTKKKTDATTKVLEKQKNLLKKDLDEEKERRKKDIDSKDTLQDAHVKLQKGFDRVSQFEAAYYNAVQDFNNQQKTIQTQHSTIKRQQSDLDWYRNENESKHQMISNLKDEKDTLLLRLSKIPDAQSTVSNPNIADLRDDKRPTKLAEDFSELYDNERTDAFECIEAEGDDEKTKVLYELLKRSYEFCETLSTSHAEAIIKSFTTLNYTKLHKQNTDVKSSNMLSGRPDRTDEIHELAKGNDDMNQTVQNYRQSSFKNTARSRPQNGKQYKKKEVPDDTKVLLIAEEDCAKKRNDVTDVTISELIFYFDDFNTEQKKTILDLRKLCEEKQANDVVQVGSKLIATEMQIENGEVMEYISKCIDICWSMCRHTPPVYINYSKSEEDLPFDKQKYRPYTKSGKFVHFVVWPVLYLHEGGPQLSKGVAQGKD